MGNHQVEESRVVNKNQKEILWEDSIKRYIADTYTGVCSMSFYFAYYYVKWYYFILVKT